MYRFIDTDEYQTEIRLPAEAMSYNGTYIEDEIAGYRTLYTSGRELLVSELQTGEINGIDGARYLGRRRPIRTIKVGYQLIADSPAEFRDKFNKLNQLLSAEQVHIIFADEPDKYFIGTKTGNTEIEPGMLAVTGEIEITCTDPYKYSTTLKEFAAQLVDDVLTLPIENNGTEPCAVSYTIENKAENGFIGIVCDKGALQLGSPEEVDGEHFEGSEILCNLTDWPGTKTSESGMHPAYNYQGTVKKINNVNGLNVTGLVINSFGTRQEGTWNGACSELILPADSTGAIGAKNFYCWMCHWFMTGVLGQTGEQGIAFLTTDNKFICGVQIVKSDAVGNDAYIEYFVNGKIRRQIHFQPTVYDSDNPFNGRGANDVLKEGDTVRFYWWGSYFSFSDPEIKDMECTKIQVTFDNYGNRDSYVSVNAISEIQFSKMNVDGWRDVPNRYNAGDTIVIDGSESKVFVNDMYRPQDEVIGSQYFKVDSGTTNVQVVVSDWCATKPTVKATIREVWQ